MLQSKISRARDKCNKTLVREGFPKCHRLMSVAFWVLLSLSYTISSLSRPLGKLCHRVGCPNSYFFIFFWVVEKQIAGSAIFDELQIFFAVKRCCDVGFWHLSAG